MISLLYLKNYLLKKYFYILLNSLQFNKISYNLLLILINQWSCTVPLFFALRQEL